MKKRVFYFCLIWVVFVSSAFATDVTNKETVTDPISMTDDDDNYTNTSDGNITINGSGTSIYFGDGNDTFTNNGDANITSTSYYGIKFGKGNNTFTNKTAGTINITSQYSGILFGIGDDTFTNNGDANIASTDEIGIYFGIGDDTFTNNGNANITSTNYYGIYFSGGNNTFTNNGNANIASTDSIGIKFDSDGNNTFTNEAVTNEAAGTININSKQTGILFGIGDDTFTNNGDANITSTNYYGIYFSGGDNIFTNEAAGTININSKQTGILFGIGDDTFTNNGDANIASTDSFGINFGDGNNTFTNKTAGTINITSQYSGILFGIGDDTFTNNGDANIASSYAGIEFSGGDNIFTNEAAGTININSKQTGILFGIGDDTFTNNGDANIASTDSFGINFGDGNNTFTNKAAGTINVTGKFSGIKFGDGDDNFTNNGSIAITADNNKAIDMGAGDDTFTTTGALNTTNRLVGGEGADTLNFRGDNNLSFGGAINTFETINKNDAGVWDLNGTITDATAININSGILHLNETVTGDIINLASTGGLGVTSPNETGTFTLNGNFNLNSATLLIDINNSAADIFSVNGTADISGGKLLVNPLEGFVENGSLSKILTATTLTGEFASVASTNPMFNFEANYTLSANEVWLEMGAAPAADLFVTPNQVSAGTWLQKAMIANSSHPVAIAFAGLTDPEQINQTIDTLTPEPMASGISASRNNVSAQNINVSSRLGFHHKFGKQKSKFTAGLMSDYFPILKANSASGEMPNSFWIKTIYLSAGNDPDDGKFEFDMDTKGVTMGRDYLIGNFMLGVSGGYSRSDIEFDTVSTDGDTDTLNLSLYGTYAAPKYYIDAILSYSNHNYDMDRYIPILNETANADYRANEYGVYLNSGYPINFGDSLTITPLLSLQYSNYQQNSFTETGSSAALKVESFDSDSVVSGLGASIEKILDYGEWKFIPNAKIMWKHEFCDTVDTVEASFAGFDASLGTFKTEGYDAGADTFALGLGAAIYKGKDTALFLNYDLGVKKDFITNAVTAGIKFYF